LQNIYVKISLISIMELDIN